jgi:hypothetical protein
LEQEGLLYDQYIDNPVYYLIFPDKEYRVLNKLNKKNIEKAFGLKKDSQKVQNWLAVQNHNSSDEKLLWNLILHLNE